MRRVYLKIAGLVAALIDMLPAFCRRELFRIAARSIGVKYAAFDGRQGTFEGPIYDRVIWPLYLSQGVLDIGTCNLLKSFFKTGTGTLIDVGANIGIVCIPIKRELPGVDAYAIEPDPDNCECLRMNAFRAGISDIRLFKRAAHWRECVLDFELSNDNAGDHRVRNKKSASEKELCNESSRPLIQVQAAPLDALIPLSNLKHPVVMTCDVQGAEVDALGGATQLLESVDVMIIEFWPYGLKRAGADLEKFFSIIAGFPCGANFYSMDETTVRLIPIRELVEQLRRIYTEESGILHYDVVLAKKPF